MKLTVHDFFDALDQEMSDLAHEPSVERIKVLTMKKIEETATVHRPMRRISRLCAAVITIIALSVAVYAAHNWNGFALTGTMSQDEIQTLMEQIEESGCEKRTDTDGTVHYFDSNGTEFMVLSAAESAQFEKAREKEQENQNQAAVQDVLDLESMTVMPRTVAPVAASPDGSVEDFLLGNGSLVILGESGNTGYDLRAGDAVTISATATDKCIVEFGIVEDRILIESDTIRSRQFKKTFIIPEDGVYFFTLMYFSSDSDNFTNCTIQIN